MNWEKSRRIGATYADSYKTVRDRNKTDVKRDLWFSSADESAAYEYALYTRQWCELFDIVAKEVLQELEDEKGFKYNNYVVEFPDGSRVNCMSSNPRRFRSKGGDVVLDEFAWHDQPGEMLDAAMPVTTWGFNIRTLSTHNGKGSEFDNICTIAKKILTGELDPLKDPVLDWSHHFTSIVDAVDQGLAEKVYKLDHIDLEARKRFIRQCRAKCRNEDAWKQEYMCEPCDTAATLIPYDLYQACESSDCLKTMGDGKKYLGFDIGRENHRTKIWLWEEVGDILVTRKVITLHKTPYKVQLKVLSDLLEDRSIVRACGDATGLGDMLVETLADRFGEHRVEKVKFTITSKDHMASLMLSRCEDRRCRLPDDPKIRASFHSVKKVVTASGNIRYDAASTDEGHADDFWAAALGLEAAWQPEAEPECTVL